MNRPSDLSIRKVIVNQFPLTSVNYDFADLAALAKTSA